MQITYKTGDFSAGDERVSIHGCNARGVMGAGAALAVRERLPFAYRVYREAYLEKGLHLGQVVWAIDIQPDEQPRIIGNAITQDDYGSSLKQFVNYDAVKNAMREVDRFASHTQTGQMDVAGIGAITAVSMPMIGAGLGGGDWENIAAIIEEESRHFTPVVYRLP